MQEWLETSIQILQEIENSKTKLQEFGVASEKSVYIGENFLDHKTFLCVINSFLQQTTEMITTMHHENLLYEETLKEISKTQKVTNNSTKNEDLDYIICGYKNLIHQCQRGAAGSGDNIKKDYFSIIMEKASLMEEIRVLKTENEMLVETQLEHYEKLKQTNIAAKGREDEVKALESSLNLAEEEKNRIINKLQLYEEQKERMEEEIKDKCKTIKELSEEKNKKNEQINDLVQKLEKANEELKNFENEYNVKDKLIRELKIENEKILNMNEIKNNELSRLKEKINEIEIQKKQLGKY